MPSDEGGLDGRRVGMVSYSMARTVETRADAERRRWQLCRNPPPPTHRATQGHTGPHRATQLRNLGNRRVSGSSGLLLTMEVTVRIGGYWAPWNSRGDIVAAWGVGSIFRGFWHARLRYSAR